MSRDEKTPEKDPRASMMKRVSRKVERRLKARREGDRNVWFWLGMYGMVGWSVAIPTVLGAALGVWIDSKSDSQYSWTLMLILGGLMLGCWNAWYWIKRESKGE